VHVAYPWLSDFTRLQWALHSLIFEIWHSDFLDIGRKIEIHNNGLLGEGKTGSFYLDIGRIIDNFHYARQRSYSAYMPCQFRLSVCPSVCHTGGSVKNS